MSVAAAVKQKIDQIQRGRVFGYEVFPEYQKAPDAVVRAVRRRIDSGMLKRLRQGRFYKPERGVLGGVPVGDRELLRDFLYRGGRRIGYITGPALYNRMGLSTQVPKTITVASERSPQTLDFGTIRVRFVPSRAPVGQIGAPAVPLLEFLDALRNAKKVPGASLESVMKNLAERLPKFSAKQQRRLQKLALKYYNAGTRALLGMLMSQAGLPTLPALRDSINPTTRYYLGIDSGKWPAAKAWNIR